VKKFLSILILCMFTFLVLQQVLYAATEHAEHNSSQAEQHQDGSPCSDSNDQEPCDQSCPCLCCPGHGSLLYNSMVTLTSNPFLKSLQPFNALKKVLLQGFLSKIYRPPEF